MADLAFGGDGDLRQARQQFQSLRAMLEVAGGYLTEHERVQPGRFVEKQLSQPGVAPAEVVDPDRCIRQDH
jgi:hypothetical protein